MTHEKQVSKKVNKDRSHATRARNFTVIQIHDVNWGRSHAIHEISSVFCLVQKFSKLNIEYIYCNLIISIWKDLRFVYI